MGKYERKTTTSWNEDDMQKAIKAFREGRSQRHAADLFGIPHSCLQRRLQSGQDKPLREKGGQSIFTVEQEKELVSRLLKLSSCGFGLDSNDVRKVAYDFAELNSIKHSFSTDRKMAGMAWLYAFQKRNPTIILRKAEGLSLARCNGLNKQDVEEYFILLRETIENLDLNDKPEKIYNADESGFQLNNKPTRKVFAEKGTKSVYSQTCVERGELVTILACTNATGGYIPPMAIFKGKKYRPEFSDDFPNGSLVTMTDSGWINEDAFLSWLQHFQTHRVLGSCVLLLDGHASHKSLKVLKYCEENDIHMVCLPSHTTHRLQPLDRSFFKPLKSYYYSECNNFMRTTKGERKINKLTFGRIFKAAWLRTATPAIAENGFRSTGVYPLNQEILLEEDFLPSTATATVAQTSIVQEDSPPRPTAHGFETSSPNSCMASTSKTFHDLLPSPIKTQPQYPSRRKQKAVLLTSRENIKEIQLKTELKRKLRIQDDVPSKKKRVARAPTPPSSSSSSASSSDSESASDKASDTVCGFCNVKYNDPVSVKLGDWVQCQGKSKEWYHEICVGARGKKQFICGRCAHIK